LHILRVSKFLDLFVSEGATHGSVTVGTVPHTLARALDDETHIARSIERVPTRETARRRDLERANDDDDDRENSRESTRATRCRARCDRAREATKETDESARSAAVRRI
jgi:hypothetical protein